MLFCCSVALFLLSSAAVAASAAVFCQHFALWLSMKIATQQQQQQQRRGVGFDGKSNCCALSLSLETCCQLALFTVVVCVVVVIVVVASVGTVVIVAAFLRKSFNVTFCLDQYKKLFYFPISCLPPFSFSLSFFP